MGRWLLWALILVQPTSALAYRVRQTRNGAPVRWTRSTVPFSLDPQALGNSGRFPEPAAVTRAVQAAFRTWESVDEAAIRFPFAGPATAPVGFDPSSDENENSVLLEADWAHEQEALALTFVSFDPATGEMLDADIVVNAGGYEWEAADDADGAGSRGESGGREPGERPGYDLDGVITHEVGHMLGLGHSLEPAATMYAETMRGDFGKRSLEPDDLQGYRFLYGAAADRDDVHGDGGGCNAARSSRPSALLVLLALFVRRRRALAVAVGVAVGLVAPPAWATVVQELDVEALARRADVVALGRVADVSSVREGGLIWTDARVSVRECLRGRCGLSVHVRQAGGEVDGVALHVEGTAELRAGDEVVLFVRRTAGRFRLVGMAQGCLRVVRTAGDELWLQDLTGVELVGHGHAEPPGLRALRPATVRHALERAQASTGRSGSM